MRRQNWFLSILAAAALFLLFIYPSFGWKIRMILSPQSDQNSEHALEIENAALKADLAEFRILKERTPRYSGPMISAFVYSRYPFNLKSELTVDAGSDRSVQTGQAVVIASAASSSEVTLVGKVKSTSQDASVIQTLFDSGFRLSVRIGDTGTSAILKGGPMPKLALVPKDAKVAEGDVVYSADTTLPFGLPVGILKDLRLSSDQLFEEADIDISYNPGELQAVFILQARK
jgi:cell shape-determining protein MreC